MGPSGGPLGWALGWVSQIRYSGLRVRIVGVKCQSWESDSSFSGVNSGITNITLNSALILSISLGGCPVGLGSLYKLSFAVGKIASQHPLRAAYFCLGAAPVQKKIGPVPLSTVAVRCSKDWLGGGVMYFGIAAILAWRGGVWPPPACMLTCAHKHAEDES